MGNINRSGCGPTPSAGLNQSTTASSRIGQPPNATTVSQKQSNPKSAAASSYSSSAAARDPSQESHEEILEANKAAQAQSDSTQSIEVANQQEKPKSEKQESQKRYDQFQSFWESISTEKKKEFLEIRVQDLRAHLISTTNTSSSTLMEDFDQAIAYGRKNQNTNCWEFWLCYCDEMFTDQILQAEHLRIHGKGAKVIRIDQLSPEWADMVLNGTWKPVDVPQALKLLNEYRKKQALSTVDDLGKLNIPFCDDDDDKRATLLARIRDMFIQLHKKRCITSTNLTFLMRYTTKILQRILPQSAVTPVDRAYLEEVAIAAGKPSKSDTFQFQKESLLTKMAESHLAFCFLDVASLNRILQFLQSLSDSCDSLEDIPDKDGSFENALNQALKIEVEESIFFSEDKSQLIIDERRITGSCGFIDWLFKGPPFAEEIELWTSLKNDRKSLVAKYVQTSERTLELLHSWTETGKKLWREEETFGRLEKIFLEVDERRDQDASKSYESVLKKRLEEIRDEIIDMLLELQTICCILNESQSVDIKQLQPQVASNSVKSESGHKKIVKNLSSMIDEVRNLVIYQKEPDLSPGQDAAMMISVKQKMERASLERNRVDARILRISYIMKKLANQFKQVPRLDYRVFLSPLLKSFLQTIIDKQIVKDAEQEADDEKTASKVCRTKSPQATSVDALDQPQEEKEEN